MTTSHDHLTVALTDVRKAYRLIHAYQRRLWDLLRAIDDTVARAGLPFRCWKPVQVMSPPKSKTRFFVERWAWDFLPAYQVGCEWQGKGVDAKTTRRVFVIAAADSGYDNRCQGEPDPSAFEPTEKSKTEIRVGLWTASTTSPNWGEAWQKVENDARENETYTLAVKNVIYTYRYFRVDVANLVNEAAVQVRLLQPIEIWLGVKAT
jgi:hypothetical protein